MDGMRCEQVGRPIQFGMLARLVRPKAREVTVRTATSRPLAVTVHTVTSLALLYNSVSPSSFELSSCVSLSPCQNWPRAGAWGGARGVGLGQDKIGIGRVPGAGPGGWGRAGRRGKICRHCNQQCGQSYLPPRCESGHLFWWAKEPKFLQRNRCFHRFPTGKITLQMRVGIHKGGVVSQRKKTLHTQSP